MGLVFDRCVPATCAANSTRPLLPSINTAPSACRSLLETDSAFNEFDADA
jgi:hypothetical protein